MASKIPGYESPPFVERPMSRPPLGRIPGTEYTPITSPLTGLVPEGTLTQGPASFFTIGGLQDPSGGDGGGPYFRPGSNPSDPPRHDTRPANPPLPSPAGRPVGSGQGKEAGPTFNFTIKGPMPEGGGGGGFNFGNGNPISPIGPPLSPPGPTGGLPPGGGFLTPGSPFNRPRPNWGNLLSRLLGGGQTFQPLQQNPRLRSLLEMILSRR